MPILKHLFPTTGEISVAGQSFSVVKGLVEVPIEFVKELASHGFTVVADAETKLPSKVKKVAAKVAQVAEGVVEKVADLLEGGTPAEQPEQPEQVEQPEQPEQVEQPAAEQPVPAPTE